MKNTRLLMIMAFAAMPVVSMFAQEAASEEDDVKVKAGHHLEFTRTSPEIDSILRKQREADRNEVPVPRFVVKSDNNSFIMTIGAVINPFMGFDIGNNLYQQEGAGSGFTTQFIPVPAAPGHKGDFFINPLNGNVDLTVVGLGNTKNAITGYIKIGTNGLSSQIKLKKAYVSWRGFTAGMKSTLMEDGDAAQPPTIDPEGPSGIVGNTAYEINYTSPYYNGFRYAVALDMPTFTTSNGVYRGKDYPVYKGVQVANVGDAEQLVPDIPAYVEYRHSDNNRIRLSGLLRDFAYRDLLDNKVHHSMGWGVMLSGNLQPVKPLIIYLQAAYGKGIGNYIQDISGLPLSFIPKDNEPGRMTPAPMMGFNLGFTINATDRLQFNLMGSEARIWNVGSYANALDMSQNYKYALYAAANCFYSITPYLQWGVEYLWGRRMTWDHIGANDNRIQTQIIFTL